jgi:hypothetical protein
MKDTATQIRRQLARSPNKLTFKKSREKLLEIEVLLEVAHRTLADQELVIRDLHVTITRQAIEFKKLRSRMMLVGEA